MKMQLLLFLLVASSYTIDVSSVSNITTNTTNTTSEMKASFDYVVKLDVALDEKMTQNYIINLVVNNMDRNNITAKDVIQLLKADRINLQEFTALLINLNSSIENVLNYDNFLASLAKIDMQFQVFVDILQRDLNIIRREDLIDFIQPLGIDEINLALARQYNNPELLKNNSINNSTIIAALTIINKTPEDLFNIVRNIFVNTTIHMNETYIRNNILNEFNLRHLLVASNLTMADINNVEVFGKMLNEIQAAVSKNIMLAALTDKNKVTINKKVYDQWENRSDMVKVSAVSLTNMNVTLMVLPRVTQKTANIFELTVSNNVSSFIKPAQQSGAIENCTYVTLIGTNLTSFNIANVSNFKDFLTIPNSNGMEYIMGSPLICGERLVGLAADANSTCITFDVLYGNGTKNDTVPPSTSPSNPDGYNKGLLMKGNVVLPTILFTMSILYRNYV